MIAPVKSSVLGLSSHLYSLVNPGVVPLPKLCPCEVAAAPIPAAVILTSLTAEPSYVAAADPLVLIVRAYGFFNDVGKPVICPAV